MKTLSLLQPWATLIAIGAKKIETRSWATKYRGPLLIHASARLGKEQKEIIVSEPFAKVLIPDGKPVVRTPTGVILCRCELVDCRETDGLDGWKLGLSEQETAFGDYSAGRFGWFLEKVEPFPHPMIAKGKLGLWDFPYKGAS